MLNDPVNAVDPWGLEMYRHGYNTKSLSQQWGEFTNIVSGKLSPAINKWENNFNNCFGKYFSSHLKFANNIQSEIDSWYIDNMIENWILYQSTGNLGLLMIEGAVYTIAWDFGTVGNQLNLMGWYFIDIGHASLCATFK